MRLSLLRGVLTWLVAVLLLIGSVAALAIVWTADSRQWYVDAAGIDLTLDITLSAGGRLVLTALLVGLGALALATLALDVLSRRARRRAEAVDNGGMPAPVSGRTFTYRAAPSSAERAGGASTKRPRQYDSMIVGKTDVRRSEGTLSPDAAGNAEETETVPPGARRAPPPSAARPDAPTRAPLPDGSDGGPAHSAMPLCGGGGPQARRAASDPGQ